MIRLIQFAMCLFFFHFSIGQNYKQLSGNFSPSASNRVDATMLQQLKQSFNPGVSNSRGGGQSIVLDYDLSDGAACIGAGDDYDGFRWQLHSQFPNDSNFNFAYNWTAVSFDTLRDANTNTPYPYSTSQVTIDSIVVYALHENFTGTQDQIVISVLEYVPGGPSTTILNGLQTNGTQTTILNNVLYSDTIRRTTSLTPGLLNMVGLIIRPNLTLAMGQKFLVSVHFYGNLQNEFYFIANYCDQCGGGCQAEASIFEDNTLSRLILWQNGTSLTGLDNNLYQACGRTPPPNFAVPGNCESWYVQNTLMTAFVTLAGGPSSGCTPPTATGTPGFTPQYNSLPCAEQGVPYSETVNFENFTTINSPAGQITMNSLTIDSITNLPCNLTWQTNKPGNTFSGGEVACIDITGTTNDPVGHYDWEMYVTVVVTIPGFGTQTFSGEMKALLTTAGVTTTDLAYYIRVKVPAGSCPPVDTSIAGKIGCQVIVQPGNCALLANVDSTDSPSLYANLSGGYIIGHNGNGLPAFAEHFTNTVNGTIQRVSYSFGRAIFGNPNSKITATIWSVSGNPDVFGNPNRPGTILATQDVLISTIAGNISNGNFTTVTFSTPASVTGDFYAGFQVTHATGDTVGLVTNLSGQSNSATIMIKLDSLVNGQWARIDSLTTSHLSISGYIFAEVCQPSIPCSTITVIATPANTICMVNNGSVMASASGGTGPYTYSWGAAGTGTSISNLAPGNYPVTATDANGCTGTSNATVGNTVVSLTVTVSSTTPNSSCTTPNGAATVSASGGTAPYSYSWSISGQTTNSISGRIGGNYSVTVTDANGCVGSNNNVTIGSSTPVITVTPSSTTPNGSCVTPNGSATVSASGGTGPYTYMWSNAQTGATISGVIGGTYSVIAWDAGSCTGGITVTVGSNIPVITVSTSSNTPNTSCATPNGTATVSASGGTGPYSYTWSNAQTGATISGVAGSSYTVTAQDAGSCTGAFTVTVGSNQPVITVSISSTTPNTSCSNPNGGATVSASGGTGSYTYSWTGGLTGASVTGLSGGSYGVTATDVNGCTGTASVSVANNATLNVSVTTSNPVTSCSVDNGSLVALATGGSGSVTYTWNSNPVQNNATASNLPAGAYSVTATDNISGCTATVNSSVGVARPTISASITSSNNNTSCSAANGSATVNATGATGSFTYAWSTVPSQTTATASGLIGGNYSVIATHVSSGCTGTASITIGNNLATVTVSVTPTSVTSCTTSNGIAVVAGASGTPPYSYVWNTIPVQTTSTATGLAAGVFSVTATDANSCTGSATVTIGPNTNSVAVVMTSTNASSSTATNGTATATPSGGSGSYSYSWSNSLPPTQTVTTAPGNYSVTVVDNNTGCIVTGSVTIGFSTGIAGVNSSYEFSLFPNPTNGKINLKLEFNKAESVKTEWYNILGENILSEEVGNVNVIDKQYDLSSFAEGIYFVQVTFGNEIIVKRVTVSR